MRRHPVVQASVAFTLLALALTGPALFGSASLGPENTLDADPLYASGPAPPMPLLNDFSRAHLDLPRDFTFARGLHAGRLDLWNPLIACGAPLWAEQGGPFFPLKLPFYVAPSRRTYDLAMALRLVVAGIGAYLLARYRGLGQGAAIVAGGLFELSGIMVAQLPYPTASPVCMLPWMVLGAHVLARRPTRRALVGTAITLGLAASGGHPTLVFVVYCGFAAAVAGYILAAWRTPRAATAIAARAVAAVALGVALAAPTLLPLAELARVGTSYKGTFVYEVMWTIAARQYVLPLPLALFAPATLHMMQGELRTVFPYVYGITIGVLGLVLAVAGLFRRGLDLPLLLVALVGMALGTPPPGFGWVHQIPLVRYVLAGYGLPLLVLPLTQAAGRGLEVVTSPGGRRTAALALAIVAIASGSLLLLRDDGLAFPWTLRLWTTFRSVVSQPGGLARLVLPPAIALAAIVAVPGLGRRAVPAVGTVAVLELLVIMWPFAWRPESAVLGAPPSPPIAFLRSRLGGGDGRIVAPVAIGRPITPSLFGLPDVRAALGFPVRRYAEYLGLISGQRVTVASQHTGSVLRSPLLDLAVARYVLHPAVMDPSAPVMTDPALRPVFTYASIVVRENAAALPRARLVRRIVVVPDEAAARLRLEEVAAAAPHAAEAGLADEVILEPDAGGNAPVPVAHGGADGDRVRISDTSDPDRLVLEVHAAEPAFLVLADTYYPGWVATIDDEPVPIFPADLLFRAVPVPTGAHTVVFRYRAPAFLYGVGLFVATAIACLALVRRSPPARRPLLDERAEPLPDLVRAQ